MMQTFDAFAVGDTIFVPSVQQKAIDVTCPDCLGGKTWTVSTPSGVTKTITCPRCGGGESRWLRPRRYERTLEIKEAKVGEVSIRRRQAHNSDEIYTSIDYGTVSPYIGHIDHDRAYRSREEAEAAGILLLADDAKKENERWREELKRNEERAGQDIVRALEAKAQERAKALDGKIEKLREKMLDAIRYPYTDGPNLTRPYAGAAQELTSQSLAEWLNNLLEAAEIECWSEEELHEATCHC